MVRKGQSGKPRLISGKIRNIRGRPYKNRKVEKGFRKPRNHGVVIVESENPWRDIA